VVPRPERTANPEISARFWPVTKGAGPEHTSIKKSGFTPRLRSAPPNLIRVMPAQGEVSRMQPQADRAPVGGPDPEVVPSHPPSGPVTTPTFSESRSQGRPAGA